MKYNYFNYAKKGPEYLLTNDAGRYAFVSEETFQSILNGKSDDIPEDDKDRLVRDFFIYDDNDSVFVEKVVGAYRDNHNYLFQSTSLHIFVMTNSCNMACVYCQAQDSDNKKKGVMSFECARKAVDIALQSPNKHLSFEFQGGEPLINFDTIKFLIEYTESVNEEHEISFSVVTNTLLLNEEIITFFLEHGVTVSTSLDGDRSLHNKNRPKISGSGTFDEVCTNVIKLKERGVPVGAIQTTTRNSLSCAEEIIETYRSLGISSVFIRPLTPLGYAKEHWNEVGYTAREFIEFYRRVLDIIIDYNRKGERITEGHATIFLRKIIDGYADNYMELRSPCGAAVGQMAYYYDGKIYTCDEGRMMAEMGMPEFCLGDVDSTYDSLMDSRVCKVTCQSSVLESIPECCDCVYSPYCGVCPVINYAMNGNIYSREANNYRCNVYKGVLNTVFDYIRNDEDALEIFKTWI